MTIQEKIEKIEIEIAELKRENWVAMKPATWYINNDGKTHSVHTKSIAVAQEFGMKYHTKEAAEMASNEMRKINRIRYYAILLDAESGWVADWENPKQYKTYILYNTKKNEYEMCNTLSSNSFIPYMSIETAEKIVENLNSGELVL